MNKSRLLPGVVMMLMLAVVTACGGSAAQNERATPSLAPTQTPGGVLDAAPQPESTAVDPPTAVDEPYPAEAAQPQPPATATLRADYPVEPTATFEPTPDPYPNGLIWINRPVGIQCEDGTTPGYSNLGEAVGTMRSAGVQIVESEEVNLAVPAACGGPTSEHYRLLISVDDAPVADSMGWNLEEE